MRGIYLCLHSGLSISSRQKEKSDQSLSAPPKAMWIFSNDSCVECTSTKDDDAQHHTSVCGLKLVQNSVNNKINAWSCDEVGCLDLCRVEYRRVNINTELRQPALGIQLIWTVIDKGDSSLPLVVIPSFFVLEVLSPLDWGRGMNIVVIGAGTGVHVGTGSNATIGGRGEGVGPGHCHGCFGTEFVPQGGGRRTATTGVRRTTRVTRRVASHSSGGDSPR